MLLRELYELHDTLVSDGKIPSAGYQPLEVRYVIELDLKGHVTGFTDKGPRSERELAPSLKRSGSQPLPAIATDNLKFLLGLAKSTAPKDEAAAQTTHKSYLGCLEACAQAVAGEDPEASEFLRAIRCFAADPSATSKLVERGLSIEPNKGKIEAASHRARFRVGGKDPTKQASVRKWWAQQVETDVTSDLEGTCQITGKVGPIARKFDALALPGNQPTLISGNFAAALRYGSSQGTGASVSVEAARKTHQALNWLLGEPSHRKRIGDVTFVWWCPADLGLDPFADLVDPDPVRVSKILDSPRTGGRPRHIGTAPFRLLGLTVSKARAVIRFDHTSAIDDIDKRLQSWFSLIQLTDKHKRQWWPSVSGLAEAAMAPGEGAARKAQRDRFITSLITMAFEGRAGGRQILNATVARCRSERKVSDVRYALLNVTRALDKQEDVMDLNQESIGSLCGRVLAVVEDAQYAALGKVNRTVVDAYYSGASTTPEGVFPRLLQKLQPYLKKAAREHPGSQFRIAKRMEELSGEVAAAGGFPSRLTIANQADFALGYWRERRDRFNHSANAIDVSSDKEE